MLIAVGVNTSGLAITSVNAGRDSRGCDFNTDEDRRAHGCAVNMCVDGYKHRLVDAVLVQVIIAAGCHDCDIPPHPVHPKSRLYTALFALNSPHPNPIHIQTLSPLSLPSRALCSICDAYVSAHDALLFLSVSREHR